MGYLDWPSLGPEDVGRRIFTREVAPAQRSRMRTADWDDWEKKLFGQKAKEGDRVWGVYNIRGTTGEGSYPIGSPELFDDDFTLTGGDDGVVSPGQPLAFHPPGHPQEGLLKLREDITPIASHGPGAAREYATLTRAMQRNDASIKTGIGWSGHYSGPGRDRELYSDERHRNVGPVGDSALGLAILNKEQRGFAFSSERGSAAYAEEQEAFKHEGWRKSYVESGGNLSPLPDECVELVSMTPRGPIYTSSNLPGCP